MKHTLIILMGSMCLYANGQQSVNAAGGNVQGSDGSVSFSIGQVKTNYVENGFQSNEGVQQPFEFFRIVAIEKLTEHQYFTISPNPTSGMIHLNSLEVHDAEIEIMDEAGRLIYKESLHNTLSSSIDLTAFARGAYLIRVASQASVQLIKIIKN